jgi:hypothetical protein
MKFEQIAGLIRHFLTFGAGYLTSHGVATESDATAAVSGVVAIIGIIWSWAAKKKAA